MLDRPAFAAHHRNRIALLEVQRLARVLHVMELNVTFFLNYADFRFAARRGAPCYSQGEQERRAESRDSLYSFCCFHTLPFAFVVHHARSKCFGLRRVSAATRPLARVAQAAFAEQREMPADGGFEAEGFDGFLADVLDGVVHRVSHENQVEVF